MADSVPNSLDAVTCMDDKNNIEKKLEGQETSSTKQENENKEVNNTNENPKCPLKESEDKNKNVPEIIISDSGDDTDTTEVTSTNKRKRRKKRHKNNRNKKRRLNSEFNETQGTTADLSKTAVSADSDIFINNNVAQFGENFYGLIKEAKTGLRPIYIDGSNVAFGHGKDEKFSVRGLKICIDYFKKRGHYVKAFVPQFRLQNHQSTDPGLLRKLVNEGLLIVTPTLWIKNERRSPYDDWYIVQTAAINGGIIVSRDGFQDIIKEQPTLRSVVEEFRLVPTWIDDIIMFPMDPLGNRKNDLNKFLKF